MSPSPKRVPPGNPQRVVGYTRVSTGKQELSPQAQQASIAAYCERRGLTLCAVFSDAVSGSTPGAERPGFRDALAALQELGAGLLVVATRDRLARDSVEAALIERDVRRCGATLESADNQGNGATPEAEFMRGVLNAAAQYEKARIRERIRCALAVKRTRGERLGGSLKFGYTLAADGVRLEPVESEQRALERMRALRSEGLSLGAIAKALTAEGHAPRGSKWFPMSIKRALAGAA